MAELSFEQIVILLILAIIGTVVVKVTFSFDLNRYLESRQKSYIAKLRNACTHLEFFRNNEGQAGFRSFFISPSGTLQWQCQQCGLWKHLGDNEVNRQADYYSTHPKEFMKQNKKFYKLLKKSGHI